MASNEKSALTAGSPDTEAFNPEQDSPALWKIMRRYTPARIGIGRTGVSMRTEEVLNVGWSHAMARDAIHRPLDYDALAERLRSDGWQTRIVSSQVHDRATYLMRPDLGRRLDEESAENLRQSLNENVTPDVVFVIADGLSTFSIESYAADLLAAIKPLLNDGLKVAPVFVAKQGRVALGDEIAAMLGAKLVCILIGERPGLSSRDSLGAYITYGAKVGTMDSLRNCISNIRDEGLKIDAAASKLNWFINEALRLQITGVGLKDESDAPQGLESSRVIELEG